MSCSSSTSSLCSLNWVSYGDVICGIFVTCLTMCTTIGIVFTTIGIANGSAMPLIIFCALKFVLSCSLLTLEHEVPPSSTLFFFLRALLGKSIATFFLFSNVVCISSLVLLTLAGGLCGFSFWYTNIYWKIFANTKADWQVSFLTPLFSLTYLYH